MLMLPILMYHKVEELPGSPGAYLGNYVTPDQFDTHLRALKDWGYKTISIDDWLEFRAGRLKLPPHPVVITFDDGYESNFHVAWPLLQRHQAIATVFLVADCLGKSNDWDTDQPKESLLNLAQIKKMQDAGIRFGSHACTHRSLISVAEADAFAELQSSRDKLEGILGSPVTALAYPYNQQNRAVRALVRKAGYQAAVLGRGRLNSRLTSPWALSRIHVHSNVTLDELRDRLTRRRWLLGL